MADRRLRLALFARRVRRYITGQSRCGYCGRRTYTYRSFTSWGCYQWTTCRDCWGQVPFIDDAPPALAQRKRGPRCSTCVDECGIDARSAGF